MKRYSIQSQLQKLRYFLAYLKKHRSQLALDDLKVVKSKIKALWLEISSTIGSRQLRNCLGASLVAVGSMSSQIQAQNFAAPVAFQQVEFTGILIPELGDIDQDGDLDVFGVGVDYSTGSSGELELGFQENIGDFENPEFSVPDLARFDINPEILEDVIAVDWETADLDNDGDFDLIGFGLGYDYVSYGYLGVLSYVENVGTASEPEYSEGVILQLDNQAHLGRDITLVDFDADGDMDVFFLGGQYETVDDEDIYFFNVLYFENTGGASSFELTNEPVINPGGFERLDAPDGFEDAAYYFASLDMADFDMDGDLDAIIVANSYDSEFGTKFMYAENTGTEFGPWEEIEGIALFPNSEGIDQFILNTIGDLDGDGDVDLFYSLAGDYADDDDMTNTYFIENLGPALSADDEFEEAPVTLFPTVVSTDLNLVFDEANTRPISILSANGKLVKQFKGNQWHGQHTFNVSDLVNGQYFVRIVTEDSLYTLPFVRQ